MYQYDNFDRQFIHQRSAQFRQQVQRRIDGQLTEDQFKPLRLQNGLYLQLHAYMLRVAIPYGIFSSHQLKQLAHIADKYDRGYGHFTTRQNIQFNWIQLSDVPDILDDLAAVDMHGVQTSGNCIRNITADPFAGVAHDEYIDPRPYCEALRQWSSAHPEFAFLPRKFKFALSGAKADRAAIKVHDIGIVLKHNEQQEEGAEIWIGGGQGRTPKVAHRVYPWVSVDDLLPTLEAILRVYNLAGRRDNKYKARIKILINHLGVEEFRNQVDQELAASAATSPRFSAADIAEIAKRFNTPDYGATREKAENDASATQQAAFNSWLANNVYAHRQADHRIVVLSLKPKGGIPGDIDGKTMRAVADLAEQYSHGEIRATKNQNLLFPYVHEDDLVALYNALQTLNLATANIALTSDIIACPGLDYCGLATARSIPVAQQLSERFAGTDKEQLLGEVSINISGCINACGHHHIADIGILGLDKKNSEYYQISIGGRADHNAAIGSIVGPGLSAAEIPDVVERILDTYLSHRQTAEAFRDTVSRLGTDIFKDQIYVNTAA